jgi:multiple sugar transport system permease protein
VNQKSKLRYSWLPYTFIFPVLLLIAVFLIYPVGNVFYYSFQNYNVNKPYYNGFAGFQNFLDVFKNDPTFYISLVNSLKWVLAEVLCQLVVGFLLALMLNQKFRGRGFFRAASFAPWAVSGVLTSMMWSLMYNEQMGVLNDILLRMGIIHHSIAWIAGYNLAFWSTVVAELWRGIPFFAITMLAGLQGISPDIFEACKVDGGNRFHELIYMILPQMKETIVLTTLLRTVWEFNNVDLIYTLTGGGPAKATMTLTMYITQTAVHDQNFGYGSALSVTAFVILALFAIIYLKASGFAKGDA